MRTVFSFGLLLTLVVVTKIAMSCKATQEVDKPEFGLANAPTYRKISYGEVFEDDPTAIFELFNAIQKGEMIPTDMDMVNAFRQSCQWDEPPCQKLCELFYTSHTEMTGEH